MKRSPSNACFEKAWLDQSSPFSSPENRMYELHGVNIHLQRRQRADSATPFRAAVRGGTNLHGAIPHCKKENVRRSATGALCRFSKVR